ncbi:MAG: hypothetical protein ACP5N1_01415 [Candidatus Woesearchaeota archaeon]
MNIGKRSITTSGVIARDGKGNSKNLKAMKDQIEKKQSEELALLKRINAQLKNVLELEGIKERDSKKIKDSDEKIVGLLRSIRNLKNISSININDINIDTWCNLKISQALSNKKSTPLEIRILGNIIDAIEKKIKNLNTKK